MKDHIIKCVTELIDKYHTRDPLNLCTLFDDLNLHFHSLGDLLKGYYIYYQGQHNIVIETSLSRTEQKIIAGHELGHVFLHSGYSRAFQETMIGKTYNKIELEANIFCAELMIPDEEIISLMKTCGSISYLTGELSLPDWLIDCKIQALKNKGYDLPYLYIVTKDSIKM